VPVAVKPSEVRTSSRVLTVPVAVKPSEVRTSSRVLTVPVAIERQFYDAM